MLNVGQKYCRMLQGEHSAILSTFIKLLFVINIFILSIFEWPFYTGFTVFSVAEQAGLNLTFSETPMTGFLALRPILSTRYSGSITIVICTYHK